MKNNPKYFRGARNHINNTFSQLAYEEDPEFREWSRLEGDDKNLSKTHCITVFPKTIVNKVKSPDVGMDYSLNAYQGCEHGCAYCYARPTHEYWGLDAGLDFEQTILIKKNADELLTSYLKTFKGAVSAITLSGNTDCYQPIERKLELTRQLLHIFLKYKYPVGIITKNTMVLRDLDILSQLSELNLVHIYLSINTLDEDLRRKMEPRTSSVKKRLYTLKTLTEHNIPTSVMMAPLIPGLNSHEIISLCKEVSEQGARYVSYTLVRLNGKTEIVFRDWLKDAYPDRASRVWKQIEAAHGGRVGDSRFGTRMKGEGTFATAIAQQFTVARNRFFPNYEPFQFNTQLFRNQQTNQISLF